MVKPIALGAPEHIRQVAGEVRAAARAMTAALGGEDIARNVFADGYSARSWNIQAIPAREVDERAPSPASATVSRLKVRAFQRAFDGG